MSGWRYRGRRRSRVGSFGEWEAAVFLARRGLKVVARNVRIGRGEIDLVARDGDEIVFVEVKTRVHLPESEWTGLENLGRAKRRALARTARAYILRLRRPAPSYRIDLVTVELASSTTGSVREIRWFPRFFAS